MRPDRFPKVNDVMLAEALRQLIPVAQSGVLSLKTRNAAMPLFRAQNTLEMWTRQERGRLKKLGGALPGHIVIEDPLLEDAANPDPGQIVPAECVRPKKPKKQARSTKCEICGQSMPKGQDCGCWGCGGCGQQLRKGEDCGCWVCRCCERYAEDALDIGLFTEAGLPCSLCGHQRGACDCVECPRHCGFLHPVGFVCKPPVVTDEDVTDEDVPF
jgi:hypothetical protein